MLSLIYDPYCPRPAGFTIDREINYGARKKDHAQAIKTKIVSKYFLYQWTKESMEKKIHQTFFILPNTYLIFTTNTITII